VLLNDKERKLLALALDSAAQPGELASAALKLIEAWRKRGLRIEEFDSQTPPPLASPKDYGLCIWPWPVNRDGPYKGKNFRSIPPDYLARQLRWIQSDEKRFNQHQLLAFQIEKYLDAMQ